MQFFNALIEYVVREIAQHLTQVKKIQQEAYS